MRARHRRPLRYAREWLEKEGVLYIRSGKGMGDVLWAMGLVYNIPGARLVTPKTDWAQIATEQAPFPVHWRHDFEMHDNSGYWWRKSLRRSVPMVKAGLDTLIPRKKPIQQWYEWMGFRKRLISDCPGYWGTRYQQFDGGIGIYPGHGWKRCDAIQKIPPVWRSRRVDMIPEFEDKRRLVAWLSNRSLVITTEGLISTLCLALGVKVVIVTGGRWHDESFRYSRAEPVGNNDCEHSRCDAWMPRLFPCWREAKTERLFCMQRITVRDIEKACDRVERI